MATSRKSPAATSRSVAKKVPAKSKQTKSGSARSVVAKQSATKKSARTVQTSSAKGRVRALASPKKVAQGPKVVAKKTRAKSSPVPKTPMKKALAVKKSPAKAVSATKQAKKAPTTKTAAKQGATIKSPAKKAPAKKATVAKAPAKKVAATKSPVKKATPSKTAVAKKAPVAKATATKAPAAKATSSSATSKTAVAKKAPAPKIVDKPTEKAVSPKIVEKKAPPAKKVSPGYRKDVAFLERQKQALLDERAARLAQEQSQKQEAAALVEEMEPGDIQFDEESGEGGTLAVDREIHLELAAKQRLLVEEIDLALRKIALGTYGICERCENLIPKQRLTAIPEARICVPCSTGGLSRR